MLSLIDFLESVVGREDELTEAEQLQLQSIAQDSYDRPATWANNLLCFHYGTCSPPPSGLDDAPKNARSRTGSLGLTTTSPMKVLPNPATTWATFDIDLDEGATDGWVVITDAQGRTVERMQVKQNRAQLVWDTRSVAPGAYQVQLIAGKQRLQTEKLIVQP